MSTAMMTIPEQSTVLITVTEETIRDKIEGFKELKIKGIDDKDGRELVSTARKTCVKLRTTAEKEHSALKEDALRECQRIDKSKRDLLALISPVEEHLKRQEAAIKTEEERIERARLQAIANKRQEALTAIGWNPTIFHDTRNDVSFLGTCSDDEFNKFRIAAAAMVSQRREAEAEAARLKAESDRLKAEEARLAAEREELDKRRREAEAADYARRKAEADQRDADTRAALVLSLRPDKEKLRSVHDQLSLIVIPDVSEQANFAKVQVENALSLAYRTIEGILRGME